MKRTKSAGAQFLLGIAQGRFIFCGDASRKNCKGLPDRHARLLVLREAMSVDSADQAGVYFGTFT